MTTGCSRACRAERRDVAAHLRHLILPLVPKDWVAVQEQDERALADARVVQAHAVTSA